MFHGDKVSLRPMDLDDVETLLRWSTDLDLNILAGWSSLRSIPYVRDRIVKRITEPPDDLISLLIEVEETPIGDISLYNIDWENRRGEIGLAIARPYWNKGYGKDAVITFLQYVFHVRNMHKVLAQTYDFNPASMRLFRSVGFTQEGLLRSHEYTTGAFRDMYVFGMLKDEFISLYPHRCFKIPS